VFQGLNVAPRSGLVCGAMRVVAVAGERETPGPVWAAVRRLTTRRISQVIFAPSLGKAVSGPYRD
jgi:hypothetical protein